MAKTHPPYPPAFRRQMVELVRAGCSPELGREFEPSARAIRNWVEQAGRDHDARDDQLDSAGREELPGSGAKSGSSARSGRSWQKPRPGSPGLDRYDAIKGSIPSGSSSS